MSYLCVCACGSATVARTAHKLTKTTCPTFARGSAAVAATQKNKLLKQHPPLCVALWQSRKPITHCNTHMSHHFAWSCDCNEIKTHKLQNNQVPPFLKIYGCCEIVQRLQNQLCVRLCDAAETKHKLQTQHVRPLRVAWRRLRKPNTNCQSNMSHCLVPLKP